MPGLADNIRKYRLQNNITQDELAKKLGKSKNVISNWERGDNRPDADSIELMCKIFAISPNDIYGWSSSRPTTIAAHFEGDEFTEEEMDDINSYVEFVKSKREKQS